MTCIKSQIEHLTKIADFNKPSSCDSLFYGKWGKWWRQPCDSRLFCYASKM